MCRSLSGSQPAQYRRSRRASCSAGAVALRAALDPGQQQRHGEALRAFARNRRARAFAAASKSPVLIACSQQHDPGEPADAVELDDAAAPAAPPRRRGLRTRAARRCGAPDRNCRDRRPARGHEGARRRHSRAPPARGGRRDSRRARSSAPQPARAAAAASPAGAQPTNAMARHTPPRHIRALTTVATLAFRSSPSMPRRRRGGVTRPLCPHAAEPAAQSCRHYLMVLKRKRRRSPASGMDQTQGLAELLRWYVAMGADEAIGAGHDRLAAPAPAPAPVGRPPPRGSPGRARPLSTAAGAPPCEHAPLGPAPPPPSPARRGRGTGFEGCALKRTATNTVFADGDPAADRCHRRGPGADEDRWAALRWPQRPIPRPHARGHRLRPQATPISPTCCPGGRPATASPPTRSRRVPAFRRATSPCCGPGGDAVRRHRDRGAAGAARRHHAAAGPLVRPSRSKGSTGTVPAIATYHPSFLLRNPREKAKHGRICSLSSPS